MKRKFLSLICAVVGVIMAFSLFAGCDNGDETENDPPAREAKTLMIGDSLFDLWKGACNIDLDGVDNLVNRAIGGTTSVYWQRQQKLIQSENPTTVLMCLGTNDIADIGRTGEQAAKGGDEYEGCLQGVLEMIKETIPDVHIYCLTVNICGENIRWNKRDEIISCNNYMREYCADKDWVDIVETERAFYDQHEDYTLKPEKKYFAVDYLHFSPAGYDVLTGIVREALGLD